MTFSFMGPGLGLEQQDQDSRKVGASSRMSPAQSPGVVGFKCLLPDPWHMTQRSWMSCFVARGLELGAVDLDRWNDSRAIPW